MKRALLSGLVFFGIMVACSVCAATAPATPSQPPAPAGQSPLKAGEAIQSIPTVASPNGQAAETTIDLRRIPIIQNFVQNGAEIYYIGEYRPLHGFLMYKEGRVQVVYLLPDMQAVIFGGIYGAGGTDITANQITEASQQNAQLKGLISAAVEQQKELERSGVYNNAADPELEAKKNILPGGSASLAPGDRILNDFITAAGVVVGEAGKPLILMLVDPQCPHCKETWSELKEPVAKGNVRVKLVPIGAEGSENEKQAAKLLRIKEPLQVWNKFVAGDKAALSGDPGAAELAAVRANMQMAINWKIQATPYIVYRGADGKVKIVQGKPDKIASVLNDVKP